MDYKYFCFILLVGMLLFNDLKKKRILINNNLFVVVYFVDIVELLDKKGYLVGE